MILEDINIQITDAKVRAGNQGMADPMYLYLGYEDYSEFRSEVSRHGSFDDDSYILTGKEKYMQLEVIRVMTPRHFNIA